MRRTLIATISLGIVGVMACSREASLNASLQSEKGISSSFALNPSRSADRQMIAFGDRNPQCPQWSNWEKLCSRTGPNGAALCAMDNARSTESSEPFCVTAAAPRAELAFRGNYSDGGASGLRFCRVPARLSASESEAQGLATLCESYDAERPFNARRIASLRHPWCAAWSDATTDSLVCTEQSGGGSATCASLAQRNYVHNHPLFCSQWSARIPCRRPFGGIAGHAVGARSPIESGRLDPEGTAAWGVLCLD